MKNRKLSTELPSNWRRLTLRTGLEILSAESDKADSIPWRVRLFENPKSILAIPGSCNLYTHDCIHLVLGYGFKDEDEAHVLGYTLGNSSKYSKHWEKFHKFLLKRVYPAKYRFTDSTFEQYHIGVIQGTITRKYFDIKNIHKTDFKKYEDYTLGTLNDLFLGRLSKKPV